MTDLLLNSFKIEPETSFPRMLSPSERFCSCCLTGEDLTDMHKHKENNENNNTYFELINACFNSQILNDSNIRCHYICNTCTQRLMDSVTFKSQVIEAQRELLDFFKVHITVSSGLFESRLNNVNQDIPIFAKSEDNFSDGFDDYVEVKFLDTNLDKEVPIENVQKSKAGQKRVSSFKSKKKHRTNAKVKNTDDNVSGKLLSRQQESDMYASMDVENLQCRKCSMKFKGIHGLRQHMNEHFINYTCEKCGKGFATIQRYFQHMRVHITGSFKCSQCARTFDTPSKLTNHRANHRASLYNCRHCKRRFKSYYTRQKHMRDEHSVMNGYSCDLCSTVCVTFNMLKVHMQRKHAVRARTHACDQCDKEFFDKQTLYSHMVIHTGQKNYVCTECNKAYARKKTLIQHMKIHNNVRDHVCSQCGLAFIQKCSLKWHMRKHEKALMKEVN